MTVKSDSIDQNAVFSGLIGSSSNEQVLWLTLYPLSIGGRYDPVTRTAAWTVSSAKAPSGRRYRSIRTVLSPAGVDLSRTENLEFWTLVDTNTTRRTANPTLVFDLGEVSRESRCVRAGIAARAHRREAGLSLPRQEAAGAG